MYEAQKIVFQLVGPATEEEFLNRLPNRPDWQRYIECVDMIVAHEVMIVEDMWRERNRKLKRHTYATELRANRAEARALANAEKAESSYQEVVRGLVNTVRLDAEYADVAKAEATAAKERATAAEAEVERLATIIDRHLVPVYDRDGETIVGYMGRTLYG